MPRMIPTFKILLPTTFPIVMVHWILMQIVMENKGFWKTGSHRNDSKSMTSWGMPKRDAILLDPSTNQSAPFSSRINPNTNKIIFICFPPGPDKNKKTLVLYTKVLPFHHSPDLTSY